MVCKEARDLAKLPHHLKGVYAWLQVRDFIKVTPCWKNYAIDMLKINQILILWYRKRYVHRGRKNLKGSVDLDVFCLYLFKIDLLKIFSFLHSFFAIAQRNLFIYSPTFVTILFKPISLLKNIETSWHRKNRKNIKTK